MWITPSLPTRRGHQINDRGGRCHPRATERRNPRERCVKSDASPPASLVLSRALAQALAAVAGAKARHATLLPLSLSPLSHSRSLLHPHVSSTEQETSIVLVAPTGEQRHRPRRAVGEPTASAPATSSGLVEQRERASPRQVATSPSSSGVRGNGIGTGGNDPDVQLPGPRASNGGICDFNMSWILRRRWRSSLPSSQIRLEEGVIVAEATLPPSLPPSQIWPEAAAALSHHELQRRRPHPPSTVSGGGGGALSHHERQRRRRQWLPPVDPMATVALAASRS
uniref:Uncharacterized protein n=1 Tax=Oryza rufipogon TaxID=4529 RepID=A0A0E0Q183_ORYRU